MALSVTSGSGTGGEQSNPQTATGTNSGGALGSNVQPGTPTQQLTSSNGMSLHDQPLTTVNLGSGTAATTSAATKPADHHFNPVFLLVALLLFVVAAAMFWGINRSGKKYNQYD